MEDQKIAFGGGCHWCTEAIFLSLKGVLKVDQGFVAPAHENASFSEAVVVHYDPKKIPLKILIAIHLHTHKSTANHSFRHKYRSAIYTFSQQDAVVANKCLQELQKEFAEPIVTTVLPFKAFKPSDVMFHNYYYKNPEKPFCKTHINPKLKLLLQSYKAKYIGHFSSNFCTGFPIMIVHITKNQNFPFFAFEISA